MSTEKKRITILDAPGHKNCIPNIIMAISQADVAAVFISAKGGDFESGFYKPGQTKEYIMLAQGFGITQLVIIISKMDMINW